MDELALAVEQYEACREVLLHDADPTERDGASFLHARIALYETLQRDGWLPDPVLAAQVEQDRWSLRRGRVPRRLADGAREGRAPRDD